MKIKHVKFKFKFKFHVIQILFHLKSNAILCETLKILFQLQLKRDFTLSFYI